MKKRTEKHPQKIETATPPPKPTVETLEQRIHRINERTERRWRR